MVKGAESASPPKDDPAARISKPEGSGSGFLTKSQQEVLDAAVREKRASCELARNRSSGLQSASSLGKSQSLELKPKDKLHDRHSRSRSDRALGKPKKSGAGGKFNWGSSLDTDSALGTSDPRDPNYDSAEESSHTVCLQTAISVEAKIYKDRIGSIVKELFLSGDIADCSQSLQDLDQPAFGHHFVKKLVVLSLDGTDRARELASCLLSSIYATVLPAEQIEQGFQDLVQAIDDLSIDVPAATNFVAHFLSRAITDDILPPAFLKTLSAAGGQGQVRQRADTLLKAPHSAERILRCWGHPQASFKTVQDSIIQLLQEYTTSLSKQEAVSCVRGIALPLVHHELVKQALCMALTNPAQQPALLGLLEHLCKLGLVSEDQLVKGFRRVSGSIGDLALDVPGAADGFTAICEKARSQGWLPTEALRAEEQQTEPCATTSQSLQAFKISSLASIKEYYLSGDSREVGRCLEEAHQPGLHSLVVKQAIQLALDARDSEREKTAVLIRELCPAVLSRDAVALGMTRLLAQAEDLSLDSPDAPHQLALMLGRLVVDEVLPPAFLTAVLPSLEDGSMGVSVVEITGKLLSARHAAERLQICWGSGDHSVEGLRNSIKDLVGEYMVTGDAEEAARCWHDLGVGFYGHQLIFTILLSAFEAPAKAELLLQLIKRFAASGEVSQTQVQEGFRRVELQLSDLQLDYPSSPKQFDSCKEAALQHGWISHPAAHF